MNQILFLQDYFKKQRKYLYFFIFSIIIAIILLIYSCYYFFKLKENEKSSRVLLHSLSISKLYSTNNTYTSSLDNSLSYSPFVIGILQIEKIKLSYPILSNSSDDLLKISVCRFAGPMPNEIGNLCIGGHNNIDNTFFGKLNQLKLGDEIKVYDLSGGFINYKIFDIKEVLKNDLSCTNQNTNGKRILTLVTCNTLKDTRMIYVAEQ